MSTDMFHITIDKEEAAQKLLDEHGDYVRGETTDDEIVIRRSTFNSSAHRATLTDYELNEADVNTSETGTDGTKVEYSHGAVRKTLEDYIL